MYNLKYYWNKRVENFAKNGEGWEAVCYKGALEIYNIYLDFAE